VRGRFLYSRSYGLDYRRNYDILLMPAVNGLNEYYDYFNYPAELNEPRGFIFNNHQTSMIEFGGEGVVTFAGLRKRTGVVLSLFGGVGFNSFVAKTDQGSGLNDYKTKYAAIDTTLSKNTILKTLKEEILDGHYESPGLGFNYDPQIDIQFMPYWGVELGYDITPRWGIGVGHKITYACIDYLDGFKVFGSSRDVHHYTFAQLYFRFNTKSKDLSAPIIQFIEPDNNPHQSVDEYCYLQAEILHVKRAKDIRLYQNDRPLPFDYRNGRLSTNLILEEGANTIRIIAVNKNGTTEAQTIIILAEPEGMLPISIRFIEPAQQQTTVDRPDFISIVEIKNLQNTRNLKVSLNGKIISVNQFNTNTGMLDLKINLAEGINTLIIDATNRVSKAQEQVVLHYIKPIQPPTLQIINPNNSPHRTQAISQNFEAKVTEIKERNNIKLIFNGYELSSNQYQFNIGTGKITSNLNLQIGQNFLSIFAENEAGSDRRDLVIIREEIKIEIPLPTVSILDVKSLPNNPLQSVCKYQVSARTFGITTKSQIKILIGGRNQNAFSFNATTGNIDLQIELPTGTSDLRIEVHNSRGNAAENKKIECKSIALSPPVISNIQPMDGSVFQVKNVLVNANISNLTRKDQLIFEINEKKQSNFYFDPNSGHFDTNIMLNEGTNILKWTATNSAGKVESSISLKYSLPQLPVIKWIKPSETPLKTSSEVFDLEVEILHVLKSGDIKLFLNGRRQLPISFQLNSRKMQKAIRLSPGSNIIRVEATNHDGKVEDQVELILEISKNPPIVKILSASQPTTSPMTPNIGRSTVVASVKGIANRQQIRFLFNGIEIVDFDYNETTGEVRKIIELTRGINTIIIEATNSDAKGQDKMEVVF
jgi:large repetitive protein